MTNINSKGQDKMNSLVNAEWFKLNTENERRVIDRVTEELTQATKAYERYMFSSNDGNGEEIEKLKIAQEKYDAIVAMYNCICMAFEDGVLKDELRVISRAQEYADMTNDAEVAAAIRHIVEIYNMDVKRHKK